LAATKVAAFLKEKDFEEARMKGEALMDSKKLFPCR